MPRNSQLDLMWPVGGVDRSLGTQRQHPFTTPDAVNVRTEDQREFRQRGGSRPGLGLALRTQLPAQVDLLTKVSIIKAKSSYTNVIYRGSSLRDSTTAVSYVSAPDYEPGTSYQGNVARLYGNSWGVAVPDAELRDTAEPFEISLHLTPDPDNPYFTGTAEIGYGMAAGDTNPRNTGWVASLTFTQQTGGHYIGTISQYGSGILIAQRSSAVKDGKSDMPGIMSLRLDTTGGVTTARLYWRDEFMTFYSAPITTSHAMFRVDSVDSSIHVSSYMMEKWYPTTTAQLDRNQRQDRLVAISQGYLFREKTKNSLEILPTSINFVNGYQLTAVDREQKLYIADYGVSVRSTTGVTYSPYNTMYQLSRDFVAEGVTEGYMLSVTNTDWTQNEIQRVSIDTTDGGSFRLMFMGASTVPIAWNATDAAVKAALEALATLDLVTVTGAAGGPWEIEFGGTKAATNVERIVADYGSLTYSGSGIPHIRVDDVQEGKAGSALGGNYQITAVYPDHVDFSPPLPGTITGNVGTTYFIAKPPKVYDAQTDTLTYLAAATGKGTVPVGCRLITLYRDRIVLAGQDELPHIWYMSRQGDPLDWDYTQEDSGAAVFAQASVAGQLADPITALISHSDECLIIGCYNSLWMLRGDPGYGGSVDQVSRKIGIVGSHAWTRTPDDMVVFLSPDGLYVMPAGCNGFPTSLSRERLPDELIGLSQETESVTLEYDVLNRGIHIFATKVDASEATHWWFDWEAKAFWRVKLQSEHEPYSLHEQLNWHAGPTILLGCRDGYIRRFDRAFTVDDGDHEIESYCVLGPFHLDREGFDEGVLTQLYAHVGRSSGNIDYEIHTGDGHESALNATTRESGTFNLTGLNYTQRPRVRGVSAIIKLLGGGDKKHWFIERLTAVVKSAGRKRVR